jgi:hypothetical protein
MQQVIAIHGAQSYGLWWLLLEEVYAEERTGALKSDELLIEFLSEISCMDDTAEITRIIEAFVSAGLIDKQLWADGYIRPNPTNSIAFSNPRQDQISKEWRQFS